ncbi:MAG: cation:dicarboxylase symporter family transporter [Planctomycetota bacterium]
MTSAALTTNAIEERKPKSPRVGLQISMGLVLGVLCGVTFGDYCASLQALGDAYVGLLQMTVLPYLVVSLIAKMGRLDAHQARQMGAVALVVLLVLWVIGILVIVLASAVLPDIQGASFFSPSHDQSGDEMDLVANFIPTNVFRALSDGLVPAVVVFCLFFGGALIMVPEKEPLLNFLDLCSECIVRINLFVVRLAPVGLFLLTAAMAGTLRVEELSKLQGYLVILTLACVAVVFGVLPMLVSCLTNIRYRDLMSAAQEPLLVVIATGKLFVALPQIVDKCEQLLKQEDESDKASQDSDSEPPSSDSIPSVMVPLAYPFPHLGKILSFVFISFAAWYAGNSLSPSQTTSMASVGTISSFASPLITMPFFLDQYQLSQDLMSLFILPGFITMRLGDIVGVVHLMTITLIVNETLQGRLVVRLRPLLIGLASVLVCLGVLGVAGRWYLSKTLLEYDLDERFLSLELSDTHDDVVVFRSGEDVPSRPQVAGSKLEQVKRDKMVRVGYHADHLPYSFFNEQQQLVGLDVQLMHRLAIRLDVRLEFVPYTYDSVIDQLGAGEIDIAIGGLTLNPERLLQVGFTEPYQTATFAVVVPDHRRKQFDSWDDPNMPSKVRLAVVYEDVAVAARRALPNAEIVVIESIKSFFDRPDDETDGLIIAAEEGSAWNILHPDYSVVVPAPVIQRPVSMAVRQGDIEWLRFMDRWLDFERLEGSLAKQRRYWIEGAGTQEKQPRWCIIRDVFHWVP